MSVKIKLHYETLTDRSVVVNVHVTKDDQTIILNAYDDNDALALADAIKDAVDIYTTDECSIR